MNNYRELLIGCGHTRDKRIHPPRENDALHIAPYWKNLTTLDNNPECKPDVVFDLRYPQLSLHGPEMLPFEENTFDEIHAYEILEHIGAQGDYQTFFLQFNDFWNVLKPDGYFCATVPHYTSPWAWGDPGHTRIINRGTLVFLDQDQYTAQLGKTAMSDYRRELGDTNFRCVDAAVSGESFRFILQAVK